jgi:hypothetical protein
MIAYTVSQFNNVVTRDVYASEIVRKMCSKRSVPFFISLQIECVCVKCLGGFFLHILQNSLGDQLFTSLAGLCRSC